MELLDELKANVEAAQSREESFIAFVRGFVDRLREAINNRDLTSASLLADEAHRRAPEMAAAVVANTEPQSEQA